MGRLTAKLPQNVVAHVCNYSGLLTTNQLKKAFPNLPIPVECIKRLYDDKEQQLELNEWADGILNLETRMHQQGHRYFKTVEGTIVFPWYLWEYPIFAMFTSDSETSLSELFGQIASKYNAQTCKSFAETSTNFDNDSWYSDNTFCTRFVDCLMSICGGYFGLLNTVKIKSVETSQFIRIKSALFSSVITIQIAEKSVPNFEDSEVFMHHFEFSDSVSYLGAPTIF